MIVYVIIQHCIGIENDAIVSGHSLFHGVFSTLEKAQEFAALIPVTTYQTKDVVDKDRVIIFEAELDCFNHNLGLGYKDEDNIHFVKLLQEGSVRSLFH